MAARFKSDVECRVAKEIFGFCSQLFVQKGGVFGLVKGGVAAESTVGVSYGNYFGMGQARLFMCIQTQNRTGRVDDGGADCGVWICEQLVLPRLFERQPHIEGVFSSYHSK